MKGPTPSWFDLSAEVLELSSPPPGDTEMTRSEELLKFLEQLRLTDLVDFLIVWAIIYGLLKLVRGTRAVQMAAGLWESGCFIRWRCFSVRDAAVRYAQHAAVFRVRDTGLFAPEIRSA